MTESKTINRIVVKNGKARSATNNLKKNFNSDEFIVLESKPKISGWRFSTRGVALRLFLTCWIVFALHFATNTVREIYPALALSDHVSFDVSEYEGLHPDIFRMPERGVFINNNPGASIMGAVPYVLLRPVTDKIIEQVKNSRAANPQAEPTKYDTIYPMAQEFYRKTREKGFDVKFGLAAGIMQAFCMAPISALSVVVMFWLLLSVTKDTLYSNFFWLCFTLSPRRFFIERGS